MTDAIRLVPVEFDPFAPASGPPISTTAPTTEPQRELWTAARFGPDANLAYNESVTVRIRGALDASALSAAMTDLVARHDALRATVSGDGLSLCIAQPSPRELPVQDLSLLDDAARAAAFAAHLEDIVSQPFDLARGPLFRAALFRFSLDEHALTMTAHHIVCDGWSTAVLLRDLLACYEARSAGEVPALPPAPSFAEYARSEPYESPEARAALAYWSAKLSGTIAPLELPTDRPRPLLKTYASRRVDRTLDEALVRGVRNVGAKAGASLFSTLLCGFAALLHRLTGQEELVVGIPAAGQPSAGLEGLVGHCVNTLPIRCTVHATQTFRELLVDVKAAMLDAFDHQACTFGSILKTLKVARDPGRLPLVSVIFNVDRGMGPDDLPLSGAKAELSANARTHENFDLFVNAVELSGKLILECQYNTALFDAATIERWLATYEQLLASVVAKPDEKVGTLRIVTDEDLGLLAGWNGRTAQELPAALCHQQIAAQARRSPDACAGVFEGRTLTYAELEARGNQLARRLRALGVRRGSFVGLAVERSLDVLVGLVGILKAGGAYVPIDPAYPSERIAFMVADAAMPVVVTQAAVVAEVRFPVGTRLVRLDADAAALAAEDPEPLAVDDDSAAPESPAYVIYTSGSTGKPKGVMVPHRALANLLGSVQREPGLTADDVVLAVTTLSFDIAVSELLLPLTVGATIVIASRDVASDGARLLRLLEDAHATFLDATPATYRLLLSAGWHGSPRLAAICTGEALPRELAQRLVPFVRELWNGYGPTETTVWSSFERVTAPVFRVLIGRPIANTQIHVLDAAMQPVPVGVPGELWIGGRGVSLGYLGREELTRERFLPDPFAREGGALLYRTGDLGRHLGDGRLECLGRSDGQVKLRGFRIELGEIEAQLEGHPDVRQAAVVVREDREGDRRLVAYVLAPAHAAAPSEKLLREHLKKTLPDYMVPQHFVALQAMPLTPSGKVDRRALPPPSQETAAREDHVAPRNDTEAMLADLWKETLGLPRVSVFDDFFDLGGHSLLASQILARLRQQQGIEVSFRKIFEAPTIAKLAAVIDAQKGDDGAPPAPRPALRVPRRTAEGPAPLSLMQERIWLFDEMDPEQRIVHNLPAAWRLTGKLDTARLDRALAMVVARHDMLRTVIRVERGQPMQSVLPEMRVPLEEVDLRAVPEEERQARMDALFDEASRHPFDLSTGPLLRTILLRTRDDEHVFFSTRHNIVWDGWSFDVFLREMREIYAALSSGVEPQLPEVPLRYADYAVWQRDRLATAEMQTQIAYWQTQLGGELPILDLPTDKPRAGAGLGGANELTQISRAEVDALAALGKQHGATLYMVLLAAFKALLFRYTGQTDLLVGTPVRARTLAETEDLIGPFVNALALRTRFDGRGSFVDLLARVREVTLDGFGHQEVPLEAIGGRPPVLRAFFSLQDARNRPSRFGDVEVQQVHVLPAAAGVDLTFWTMESKDKLLLVMNYRTDLFERETIVRFFDQYTTLLSSVLRDPSQPLAELSLLSAAASPALAAAGEGPELQGLEGPLDALVLREATEHPSAMAIEGPGRASTYAELGDALLAVAERLETEGVRPGDAVLVAVERGPLQAAAILGALHAGARAVFVDPAWPEARLRLASERAGAVLALVSGPVRDRLRAARTVDVTHLRAPAARTSRSPRSARDAALVVLAPSAEGALQPRALSHADLVSFLGGLRAEVDLTSRDVLLAVATPGTELAIAELCALGVGARVVAASDDDVLDGEGLCAHAERSFATLLLATPSLARRVRESGSLARLRVFVSEGPAQDGPSFRGGLAIGPMPLVAQPTRALRPAAGARARILDPRGHAVPGPALGELFMSVDGAREDASPVVDPFDPGRFLRSAGLHARWLIDGGLALVPGGSRIVRLRGVEVSLAEVERELGSHAALAGVHVRVHQDAGGEPLLVAYYARQRDAQVVETELRRHLRRTLPEAALPRAFVEVPALPRDAFGDVKSAALPPPFGDEGRRAHVAPRTASERMLGALWQRELGLERVGVHDNFFDLGGHSLLCFRVLAEIERSTGKRISPRTVLLSTLEQVARELEPEPEERGTSRAEVPPKEGGSLVRKLLSRLTGR